MLHKSVRVGLVLAIACAISLVSLDPIHLGILMCYADEVPQSIITSFGDLDSDLANCLALVEGLPGTRDQLDDALKACNRLKLQILDGFPSVHGIPFRVLYGLLAALSSQLYAANVDALFANVFGEGKDYESAIARLQAAQIWKHALEESLADVSEMLRDLLAQQNEAIRKAREALESGLALDARVEIAQALRAFGLMFGHFPRLYSIPFTYIYGPLASINRNIRFARDSLAALHEKEPLSSVSKAAIKKNIKDAQASLGELIETLKG